MNKKPTCELASAFKRNIQRRSGPFYRRAFQEVHVNLVLSVNRGTHYPFKGTSIFGKGMPWIALSPGSVG